MHCLVNRLQPLPFDVPVIVSLNPIREPAAALGAGRVPRTRTRCSTAPRSPRRQRLPTLQGRADTWFCGAWTGLGSHEDGLASALDVCAAPRAPL